MGRTLVAAAAGAFLALLSAMPASAQAQINVCGVPPLPPCERPRERVIIQERSPRERVIIEERGGRDFGRVCRTRNLRCRSDEPRPVGARCICEDVDGEEVVGRIVR
jgi:hypothetical protein